MADKVNLLKDSTMVKMANLLANAIRKYAPYEAIKKSVKIGKREGRGTSRFIQVWVGGKRAPFARAFDIGSGIHGKYATPYTIRAKNGKVLSFYWEREQVNFVGQSVQHPGVKGVGYTQKAIKEVRQKIREELKKDVGNELRLYLKAKFSKIGE